MKNIIYKICKVGFNDTTILDEQKDISISVKNFIELIKKEEKISNYYDCAYDLPRDEVYTIELQKYVDENLTAFDQDELNDDLKNLLKADFLTTEGWIESDYFIF